MPASRRVHGAALASLCIVSVGLLAGCASSEPRSEGSPIATASVAGTRVPSPPGTTTPAPKAKPKPKATNPKPAETIFSSPTGNIRCAAKGRIGSGRVTCATMNNSIAATTRNDGSIVELSDATSRPFKRGQKLAYGRSITVAGFVCESAQDGMACTSTQTGDGFFVNHDGQDLLGDAYWDPDNVIVPPSNDPPPSDELPPTDDLPPIDPDPDDTFDFCSTHDCIPSFDSGRGSIVQCNDGMWSQSGGLQGACSYHGGVRG